MKKIEKRYLSVADLSHRWGVSARTIYNWRSAGAPLPRAIRLGNQLKFDLMDVERFEMECAEATNA